MATLRGGEQRADRADGAGREQRGYLDWENSGRSNFHALICMSFAWSSRNGPATAATPTPAVPGTPEIPDVKAINHQCVPLGLEVRYHGGETHTLRIAFGFWSGCVHLRIHCQSQSAEAEQQNGPGTH